MKMKLGRYLLCGLALISATKNINAGELVDPPVFASSKDDKTLDLLMIAKQAVIDALPGVTGWAYEICERKYSVGKHLPTRQVKFKSVWWSAFTSKPWRYVENTFRQRTADDFGFIA